MIHRTVRPSCVAGARRAMSAGRLVRSPYGVHRATGIGHILRRAGGLASEAVRQPPSAFATFAASSAGFTFRHASSTRPSSSIRNVLRSTPMYVRPYMDFFFQTP